MAHTAFQITEEDIENVLRANLPRLASGRDADLTQLAEEVYESLNDEDFGRMERAALVAGTDLDEQTAGAYEELTVLLERDGWLKPKSV